MLLAPASSAVVLYLASCRPATRAAPPPPAAVLSEREAPRYGRDIRPILSDRCFKCHGPDAAQRQAGLRLDQRDAALADRGGYAAIVPGDPQASELWQRVNHHDPGEIMPPSDSNKRPLAAEEKTLLRRWIEAGAPYESHWAFVPPVRPEPPAVAQESWCRTAVDRFILAKLEAEGVRPSPEAPPETLLRRLFLDLTGLPPTPQELAEFTADPRPDAYQRWIDKLLDEEPYASRYAERLATPWLDAARYADTSGIHMDAGRQIWPWRDWLLAALRDGMPFDQFLTEQLAGDLLPAATQEQKVASGFHRNHVTSDEGGAINEEYLVEYAVDRTATTGAVFLGLTLGCARCHEHKYDPISQEDFYRLYAYFNSVEEPGVYSQVPDANRALEPFLTVPSTEQIDRLAALRSRLAEIREQLARPAPEDELLLAGFLEQLPARTGVSWADISVAAAESSAGATLTVQDDSSVLASGANPARDTQLVTLRTGGQELRLLLLEALADPSLPAGRVGRGPNGNAVLSEIELEAVSLADPGQRQEIRFQWAWADVEQADGDFDVVNAIDGGDERGWAVDAHRVPGGRRALFLSERPFGFPDGTELRVKLGYRSVYDQHALGRVRLSVGRLGPAGLDALPTADSRWYLTGPFPKDDRDALYDTSFGPELAAALDLGAVFAEQQSWRFAAGYADGQVTADLAKGRNASYLAKRLFAPAPRRLSVSLGSDDGVQVYLDGRLVYENRVDRAVAADQDQASVELEAGPHSLVLKIVNTGGDAGFYWRPLAAPEQFSGDLVWSLLPERARDPEIAARYTHAWRNQFSPIYRALTEKAAGLEQEIAALEAAIPRTMVMSELPAPRETYLLLRGQYDKPDKSKPIARGVPAALGRLPEDAPPNRLGLAQWLTAADNPLVTRVAVNRLWELLFGTGLVSTSEDFGLQGEWPSHPELLDWLAVEFRESGWDVKGLLRLLVSSSAYRQSSRARPELYERDPDNRWLAFYPRRKLGAEEIRDQALYVAGLLVEKLGGPSVKPYQPEGLWQEVAMPQSNTRVFERGSGEELWRRSLYTYWKRACPPPSLMTFDAPTREFCNVRRATTNTPLQALVLWNDEQFVEAARVLAQRTLAGAADDPARLSAMFRRCTGRDPEPAELERIEAALAEFRERYRAAPGEAHLLLEAGEAPLPAAAEPGELAAWTMIASAMLNLDATINRS